MSPAADPATIAAKRLRQQSAHSDPVTWAAERLKIDLYSEQRTIAHLVRDNRRIAVRSSHEIGKTLDAAVLGCWWIDTHPVGDAFFASTAPTGSQLRAVLWREINRLHARAKKLDPDNPLPGRVNQTEWWIGSEMVGIGRKPAEWNVEAFQGIHARYVLAVIDEATGVPASLWAQVEGITSNDNSKVLAIGNPDDPESEFARVSAPTNKIWVKHKVSAFDTPNFTGEKVAPVVAQSLVGRQWVEDRRVDWGEESTLYTSRVLGEFPDLSKVKDKVVPVVSIMRCLEEPDPDERKLLPTSPVELGMDVAAGGDETVLREHRGAYIGREWRAHTPDPDDATELAVQAAIESGADLIKVDEIGWGWGIVAAINQQLRAKKLRCRAVGINWAKAARRKADYVNLRAEIWWTIGRQFSVDGAWVLHGMDNPDETIAQLTDPHWFNKNGRIQVESKDETKKRIGRSPDNADALLLAMARPIGGSGRASVSRPGAKPRADTVRSMRSAATIGTRQLVGSKRRGSLVARSR